MKCYEITNDKGKEGIRFEHFGRGNSAYDAVSVGQLKINIWPEVEREKDRIKNAQVCFMQASLNSNVLGRSLVHFRKPEHETEAILVKWDIAGRDSFMVMTEGGIVALDYESKTVDVNNLIHLKNASILVVLMLGQSIYAKHNDLDRSISVYCRRKGEMPEITFGSSDSRNGTYTFSGRSLPDLLHQDS
ncbi:MAG: hypothetical protein V1668_01225 [Patescibacteria group bacterium]